MIEQLPLLPSTWAEWDWTKSNGESTATQMEHGYNALLNQGLCSSFSRFIWNDLVDSVVAVLDTAGLTWDSTYCGASDCKISAALGSLTATMFNSVALNVHRFGFIAWKWAMAASTKGYVGRDAFYGYSTHKADADFLYGWYIVELTVKLNRVIQVLKEEADFGEFSSVFKIEPIIYTNLFCDKAGILDYTSTVKSYAPVPLAKVGLISNIVQEYVESYANTFLRASDPELLTTTYRSKSVFNVYAEGLRTGAMNYDVPIETISHAALTPLVFVGYMRYIAVSETKPMASIDISNIKYIADSFAEYSNQFSHLSQVLSFPMAAIDMGQSYSDGNLTYADSLPSDSRPFSFSYESVSPSTLFPIIVNGKMYERSVQNSVLQRIFPLYVQRSISVNSSYLVEADSVHAIAARFQNHSKSMLRASTNSAIATAISHVRRAKSVFCAAVHTTQSATIDSAQVSIADIDSVLTELQGLYSSSTNLIDSKSYSLVRVFAPIPNDATAYDTSYGEGKITLHDFIPFTGDVKINSCHSVSLVEKTAITLGSAVVECSSNHTAILENLWYYPIQTDNNLYIRSAHPQQQNGTNIHLGINNSE